MMKRLINKTPLEKWIADKLHTEPNEAALRDYQLKKLRETLAYVKERSRFYAAQLRAFDADDIKSMDDTARLPFTTPSDIAACPNDFLCVSPHEIGRIVTLNTSGTTGNPKRVFFTPEDQELTIDFFHHGMTTLTEASDRVLICMPGSTPGSIGDLLRKGLSRFGCESIVYGPVKDDTHALETIINENITSIVGIPSQIYALARLSEHVRAKPALKSVLLSADYVPKSISEAIEKIWGVNVYGHYGMTETGLGGGVECDALEGYHLRESDLLFEVIDPDSGCPVPDGTYGEVVFTTLTRRGMPLIRYKTGDRARFLTEPCPCGTLLRRLDRITNRLAEPLTLLGGSTLSVTQLDEVLYKQPTVARYCAQLRTESDRDGLCITVQPTLGTAVDPYLLSHCLQDELPHLFTQNTLLLEIVSGAVDYFTNGTIKRKITDIRC